MSEFYTVKIRTPGKKVHFRNRVVRSPVELEMTKEELDVFKVRFGSGIVDYSIESSTKKSELKEKIGVTIEPLIEELEVKSTLEE